MSRMDSETHTLLYSIVLILASAEYGAQVFQLRPVITTMKLIEMTVIITILDILSLRHIWIK